MKRRYIAFLLLALTLPLGRAPGSAQAEMLIASGLENAFLLVYEYDQATGAGLLAPLDAAGVDVRWSPGRPAGGQLSAFQTRGGAVLIGGTILVDGQLLGESDQALAAVLVHEVRHAADMLVTGRRPVGADCAESEIRAHDEQARAWLYYVGPAGKLDAASALELDLNDVAIAAQAGPDAIQQWVASRGLSRC